MKKLIGCCGLNCETCDAYQATLHNDNNLREKTAQLWSQLNNTSITPETIHCTGCRTEGVKTFFCNNLCKIRQCAKTKGLETCGHCSVLKTCPRVAEIHKRNQEALHNLISIINER